MAMKIVDIEPILASAVKYKVNETSSERETKRVRNDVRNVEALVRKHYNNPEYNKLFEKLTNFSQGKYIHPFAFTPNFFVCVVDALHFEEWSAQDHNGIEDGEPEKYLFEIVIVYKIGEELVASDTYYINNPYGFYRDELERLQRTKEYVNQREQSKIEQSRAHMRKQSTNHQEKRDFLNLQNKLREENDEAMKNNPIKFLNEQWAKINQTISKKGGNKRTKKRNKKRRRTKRR
jgi:hypothetical protein